MAILHLGSTHCRRSRHPRSWKLSGLRNGEVWRAFAPSNRPYLILNRSTEREVLPVCQTYGMGTLVWSPLAKGMLTGRYRKGQPLPDSLRVKAFPEQMANDRNLDAVERLIPIAEVAGLSLTHMGWPS